MRGLTPLVIANQNAAAQAIMDKHAVADGRAVEETSVGEPITAAQLETDDAPDTAPPEAPAAAPRRVFNTMQITIVHVPGESLAITATAPYIEEPHDPVIINARNYLLKEFERITAPLEGKPGGIVYGEWTAAPGEEDQPALRLPSRNQNIQQLIVGG